LELSGNKIGFTSFLRPYRIELGGLNAAGLNMDGQLDDVAVWNVVLEQTQIDKVFSGDIDGVITAEVLQRLTDYRAHLAEIEKNRGKLSFEDVTAAMGITGSGSMAAWGDYDNDGWVDLHDGRLWRNQKGKGFNQIELPVTGQGIWGDFDNDGYLDLYTIQDHKLARFDGEKFQDVSGLLPPKQIPRTYGATWGDFDGDGFIDLYITGFETVSHAAPIADIILHNEQGKGFRHIWTTPTKYAGRGVTIADYDEDGDTDIYVSNYRLLPNYLWRNDGNGNFSDIGAHNTTCGDGQGKAWGHTIGSCWGDLDNDGHIDLFVGNFSHPPAYQDRCKFYRNLGPEGEYGFFDLSDDVNLRWQESYASPVVGDFDNNGFLDVVITTCYAGDKAIMITNRSADIATARQTDLPHDRSPAGKWTFQEVTEDVGINAQRTAQAAYADFDNDGDLDLMLGGKLLRNNLKGRRWLKVKLDAGDGVAGSPVADRVNRAAIGATVRVHANDWIITRTVEGGTGQGNQNDLTLHFGLGDYSGALRVDVTWPDGSKQATTAALDRLVKVTKGAVPPLEVLSAYYMPDPRPPADSNVVEGELKPANVGKIFEPVRRLYTDHADFGAARVVVRNTTDAPVRLGEIALNGRAIEEHYVDFLDSEWDDRGVVWYRVRPRTVEPGGCAHVYIRFRRRPAGDRAVVTVHPDGGQAVTAVVPYEDPGLGVEYVMADEARDTLYIYARRRSGAPVGKLTGVSLDGVPLRNVTLYGSRFPGGVALAVARLPEALKIGDSHVAGVQTDMGKSSAAQFRVLPYLFMRSSLNWSPQSPEEVRELHMNTAFKTDTFTLEKCEAYGIYTDGGGHARHRYEYFYDEPDAKDQAPDCFEKYGPWQDEPPTHTGRAWAQGLGRNARALVTSDRFEKIEREQPHAASYIITNGTTRPLNLAVYGQLTDIASTDPYPVNFFGADHSMLREQHALMWQCSRPNVMHACMEAYQEGSISPRRPTGDGYRQNIVQALGCGAKGITSWVANLGDQPNKGWMGEEGLKQAVIDINALTEHIEDDLVLRVPIDIVSNDAGLTQAGSFWYLEAGEYQLDKPWMKEKVWTGALLCGPDAIVVAAVNHIPASRTAPQDIAPARNVTITVQLPDFLPSVAAFEATATGEAPFPSTVEDGKAVIKLDSITSGRMFVLRRTD
jgi:hypothetical protein